MPQKQDPKPEMPPIVMGTAEADAAAKEAEAALGALAAESAQALPGTIPVRLTIRPEADQHVHLHELPQLRSQGLLIEDPAPDGATVKAVKAGKDQ